MPKFDNVDLGFNRTMERIIKEKQKERNDIIMKCINVAVKAGAHDDVIIALTDMMEHTQNT